MNVATLIQEHFETAEMRPTCQRCDFGIKRADCTCPQRSCADCDDYFPTRIMVEMSDGRQCCPRCSDRARHKAAERRQTELFCAQDRLFE